MRRLKNMQLTKRITLLIIVAVTIPSVVFTATFFSYMERNIITDAQEVARHQLVQQSTQIVKNIEAIRLTERIFKGETNLVRFLEQGKKNKVDSRAALEFFQQTLKNLESIINNNPYLYQTRIYLPHENIQEMVPVIYHQSRLEQFEWYSEEDKSGWVFGYTDTLFNAFEERPLVGYTTEIRAPYTNEPLAVMEITMLMETMFPILYEEKEGQWAWFIDKNQRAYGKEAGEVVPEAIQYIKFSEIDDVSYQKVDGRDYIVGMVPVEEMEGSLVIITDISENMLAIANMKGFFFAIIALSFGIFGLALKYVTDRIFKKFYDILFSIQEIQKGNLNLVIDTNGTDEVSELGMQINKMSEQIKQLMEENVHRQILIKNSEIKALQNQINAHFIYNVLESIKMMAEIDEKYEISDATTALGRLLRYTMKWTSSNVYVKEELEYIQNYLKLINLRFDYEIKLALNLPPLLLEQKLPKMALQPIIENAIYHGIEDIAEDTTLYIRGYIKDELGIIEVTDTGKGMSQEALEKLEDKLLGKVETSGGKGNGIGLKNVQDRLKMSFGEAYGLKVESRQDYYTKVRMVIPITVSERESEDKHA